jgi:hypothetical protein
VNCGCIKSMRPIGVPRVDRKARISPYNNSQPSRRAAAHNQLSAPYRAMPAACTVYTGYADYAD